MVAIVAAFLAAIAQWVVTPFMAQGEIRNQRQIAVASGVDLLADISRLHAEAGHWDEISKLVGAFSAQTGMPEGQSVVLDADWKVIAKNGAAAKLPSTGTLAALPGSAVSS